MIQSNEQGYLQLKALKLINEAGNSINIINLVRDITITESMITHWMTAEIQIEEQFRLRETFPIVGKEKVRISWNSGEGTPTRTKTFILDRLPVIAEPKTNEIESYKLFLIEESFVPFMETYAYQKHWVNQTKSAILTDLFGHYNTPLISQTSSTLTMSYLSHSEDIKETMDDILTFDSDPHVLYQTDSGMVLNSLDNLFAQTTVIPLNNASMVPKSSVAQRNAVRNITKNDIIKRKVVSDDGVNGHIYFKADLFGDSYTKTDVSLRLSGKFKSSDVKTNILRNPSCAYLYNYYVMDYVGCDMLIPDSSLALGQAVSLKFKALQNDQKDRSTYSGKYIIFTIEHKIDANLNYSQNLRVIRKD